MTTAWSFLLVLTGIILVHEFGHFIVARGFGIRVLKFSVGMGPRVWGVVRGATDYCISLFPLGGFVKMLGEQPDEEIPVEERSRSFSHKPVWQRSLVVAAGPVFNFIFAWLIFFVIFLIYGKPIILPNIGQVQAGSPAEKAGMMPGDRIISIEGHKISTWEEVSEAIKTYDQSSITLTLERDEAIITVDVVPEIYEVKNLFGEEIKVPMIGVSAAGDFEMENLGFLTAIGQACSRTWELIVLTGQVIVKLIQQVIPFSTLGGPIMIAQMAGQQAELGIINLFYFMALLSINIGFLNLLPIPVLDGGHLAFLAIEGIRGRPLTIRQKMVAQQIGIFMLLVLMVFIFYNDIVRLLGLSSSG
jgi:regulator of sigma E protease